MHRFLAELFSFKNNLFGPIPLVIGIITIIFGIYVTIHIPATTVLANSPQRLQLQRQIDLSSSKLSVICDTIDGNLYITFEKIGSTSTGVALQVITHSDCRTNSR